MNLFGYELRRKKKGTDTPEIKTTEITEEQERQIILDSIEEYEKKRGSSLVVSEDSVSVPTKSGRVSQQESSTGGIIPNIMGPEQLPFDPDFLKVLQNLAQYDRHISYAVENVVSLSHTDMEIEFSGDISEEERKERMDYIINAQTGWYDFSTGGDGLTADLFAQIATFGALSVEAYPDEFLEGIKKAVRVSPIHIRFSYNQLEDEWIPLQETISGVGLSRESALYGYNQLNKETYSYIALRRIDTTPYGVPPFLAAIEDIITEREMLSNFKNMMKRVGMLGFLSVLVKAPKPVSGETPDTYRSRVNSYLDEVTPAAEASYAKGVAVGVKDMHEFNLEGTNMNVQGGEALMGIIKKLILSGIKQDPSMHGENFSTTETFARVILGKMSKQMESYQRVVASWYEKVFMQELKLANLPTKSISVKFKKPTVTDEAKDAETSMKWFNVYKAEYEAGLIGQQGFAEKRGYSEPFAEESKSETLAKQAIEQGEKQAKENDKKSNSIDIYLKAYRKNPQYNYEIPEGCESGADLEVSDFNDPILNEFSSAYQKTIEEIYYEATSKVTKRVKKKGKDWNETTTETKVKDDVLTALLETWQPSFVSKIGRVIPKFVEPVYSHYRKDDSIFLDCSDKGMSFEDDVVPEGIFEQVDYRTMEFLEESDQQYLGQFITDEDTIKRINSFIDEAFEEGTGVFGNSDTLNNFVREFNNKLNLEVWKIRRIIETTMSTSRSFASIQYMGQADTDTYEVAEVLDTRTCRYCQHLDGKVFSVDSSIDMIGRVVSNDSGEIANYKPFATVEKINNFEQLTNAQLQSRGFTTPPFHPHCRGRVIVNSFKG